MVQNAFRMTLCSVPWVLHVNVLTGRNLVRCLIIDLPTVVRIVKVRVTDVLSCLGGPMFVCVRVRTYVCVRGVDLPQSVLSHNYFVLV